MIIKVRITNLSVSTVSKPGFTLVELMIVVSILGILAAIVLPEFRGHIQQAKEAAAKDNLRTLRTAIERYAADHNGVPPGYPGDDPTGIPTQKIFTSEFMNNSEYFISPPENSFTGSSFTILLTNDQEFPTEPTDLSGWLYKASSKTIRLNTSGVDSQGIPYFDY